MKVTIELDTIQVDMLLKIIKYWREVRNISGVEKSVEVDEAINNIEHALKSAI